MKKMFSPHFDLVTPLEIYEPTPMAQQKYYTECYTELQKMCESVNDFALPVSVSEQL